VAPADPENRFSDLLDLHIEKFKFLFIFVALAMVFMTICLTLADPVVIRSILNDPLFLFYRAIVLFITFGSFFFAYKWR
jgi:hypothetical protein